MKKFDISKFKILIVDDNTFMRRILSQVLRSLHISEIVEATDGWEALAKLKTFDPDLILVDWEMEPINGLEFIKTIRTGGGGQNKFVPIVMVTEFSEQYRITEARDAGVNELIVKPISVNLLYTRIVAVIERPRQFVDSPDYFGPDRRRHQIRFAGEDKRQEEPDVELETLDDDGEFAY